MLYLEDYLEMIEHLPQELRDRFTEMREMDLSVQNNMDSIHCRSNGLFASCRQVDVPTAEHESEHNSIKSAYVKVIEDADEKVNLANQMYDLVERYLRRLDSELYKFKCELEADHNGITEILEKRSLELDGISSTPITGNQKENRYFGVISSGHDRRDRYRPKPEKRRDSGVGVTLASIPEKRPSLSSQISNSSPSLNIRPNTPNVNAHHTVLPQTPTGTPSSVSYNLQHIGAGNAIAAAASQAIVATQQMQQGRRTASLKASYEAIHGTSGGGELLIGREFAGATHNAIQAVEREGSSLNNPRRTKKKLNASGMSQHQQSPIASSQQQQPSLVTTPTSSTTNLNNAVNQVYVSTTNNISVVNAGAVITTNASSTPTQSLPVNMLDGISNMGGSNSSVGSATSSSAASGAVMMNDGGIAIETTPEGDWLYDPNEPRYCVCNQVSYGDMVACDNENCPFEWFHYPCVGITQSPKGKWYCPKCTLTMKRRSRKN